MCGETIGFNGVSQERGRWPFLTPKLESVTDQTKQKIARLPLIKQMREFIQKQLEPGHEKLKIKKSVLISVTFPFWEKKHMDGIFSTGKTIFDTFIQDLLCMSIYLLLTLYLVFPRYLFSMRLAFMFSRGVETLSFD